MSGTDRPAWLRHVVERVADLRADDLSTFTPPDDVEVRRSAVLVLLGEGGVEGDDGPDLLLTERAHDMRSHPGQVSFPGGSLDPGETPVEAALREAREEVGLDASGVEVVATLPDLWLPPSGFAVTPVLAWWREPAPVHVASPAEVHAVLRVPVSHLVAVENRIVVRHPAGFRGPGFLIGEDRDVVLWGFTGGLVARLLEHLGWAEPVPDLPEHDVPEHMLAEYRERVERDGAAPAQDLR